MTSFPCTTELLHFLGLLSIRNRVFMAQNTPLISFTFTHETWLSGARFDITLEALENALLFTIHLWTFISFISVSPLSLVCESIIDVAATGWDDDDETGLMLGTRQIEKWPTTDKEKTQGNWAIVRLRFLIGATMISKKYRWGYIDYIGFQSLGSSSFGCGKPITVSR